AVRAAEGLEFLPVNRRAAVAPVARADMDDDAVDEPGHGVTTYPAPEGAQLRRRLVAGDRHDVDCLAATLEAELDRTGCRGEQRVVAAATDVDARVEVGA